MGRVTAAQGLEVVAAFEGEIKVMGDFWQFLYGLAVDVKFVGVEVYFGQLVILSLGVELYLILALPEAPHLVHP